MDRTHIIELFTLDDLLKTYSNHIFKFKTKDKVIYYGMVMTYQYTSLLYYITDSEIKEEWYILNSRGEIEYLDKFQSGAMPIIEVKRDSVLEYLLHRIMK